MVTLVFKDAKENVVKSGLPAADMKFAKELLKLELSNMTPDTTGEIWEDAKRCLASYRLVNGELQPVN